MPPRPGRFPSLPVERETDVLRQVLTLLEILQVPHFRSNAGGGYRLGKGGRPQLIKGAPEDWPDVTGLVPHDGRFLGIEVKRPCERPTPGQLATLRSINDHGGVGFWTANVVECQTILARVLSGWRIEMGSGSDFMAVERRSP